MQVAVSGYGCDHACDAGRLQAPRLRGIINYPFYVLGEVGPVQGVLSVLQLVIRVEQCEYPGHAVLLSFLQCWPSANSSSILRLKAGRSRGLRLVTSPRSVTTSSSTQLAPALRMSVRRDGYEVTLRSRITSASTSS